MSYTDSLPLPPRTLTEVEQARLLKATAEHAAGYRDHMIISAALGTALREAELLALNISDVFGPEGRSLRRVQLRVYKKATTTRPASRSSCPMPCGASSTGSTAGRSAGGRAWMGTRPCSSHATVTGSRPDNSGRPSEPGSSGPASSACSRFMRYVRCRGGEACPHSQVAARALEESVVGWLRAPPADQMPESLAAPLCHWTAGWSDLWPVFRQRPLRVLVREVRWDGASSTFQIVLDEKATV